MKRFCMRRRQHQQQAWLRRRPVLAALSLGLCCGGMLPLMATPAQAQSCGGRVPPVVPPGGGLAIPPLVGQPGSPSAPLPVPPVPDGSGVALPGGMSAASMRLAMLLGQMLDGVLSPAQAWQKGELTADDVIAIFRKQVGEWGRIQGREDEALMRALAGLLAQHAPQRVPVEQAATLPRKLRLWLGEYYRTQGDARAEALFQSVLAQVQEPQVKEDSTVVLAHLRLGRY